MGTAEVVLCCFTGDLCERHATYGIPNVVAFVCACTTLALCYTSLTGLLQSCGVSNGTADSGGGMSLS